MASSRLRYEQWPEHCQQLTSRVMVRVAEFVKQGGESNITYPMAAPPVKLVHVLL